MELLPINQQQGGRLVFGWAVFDPTGRLNPLFISRREPGHTDVVFKIMFCGICHYDTCIFENLPDGVTYPIIPGHEIVGVVTEVGLNVQRFRVGDRVGLGCIVGSCGSCRSCQEGHENYCPQMIRTCGAQDKDGNITQGGLSETMIVDERFVVRIPDGLSLERAAPLLCGGVAAYSALKTYGLDKPGIRIGIIQLTGIGRMAMNFATVFGAQLTIIASPLSAGHARDISRRYLDISKKDDLWRERSTLDALIVGTSDRSQIPYYIDMLKRGGKLIIIGDTFMPTLEDAELLPLLKSGKLVVGAFHGGVTETEEMLNFVVDHDVESRVRVIPISKITHSIKGYSFSHILAEPRYVVDVGATLHLANP